MAELAALIHEQTGDREMLEWATRIYRWVRSALLRTDGLYADQIAPDGTVNPAIWSYNQGTMIGAGALLHRITGEPAYMEEALSTTSASMRHFDLQALLTQDAAFNAVYFRNLLLRAGFDGDTQYMASAEEYADAMWMQARDRRSGLFRGKGSVLNSTAPMIEIYALVAGAAPSA